ncbi:hypothetical protein L479_02257 [Exiguobacterium sp. S17]|nr:hypothetical protein L479_02257 [Exiguobacterium sp. S17]
MIYDSSYKFARVPAVSRRFGNAGILSCESRLLEWVSVPRTMTDIKYRNESQ